MSECFDVLDEYDSNIFHGHIHLLLCWLFLVNSCGHSIDLHHESFRIFFDVPSVNDVANRRLA